jgi:hypothetical protein
MGTEPVTPPAVDPSAGPQHPTYADGTPILVGHYVRVVTAALDHHAADHGYAWGVVVEVRFIAHRDEVWISTDTGGAMIFRAADLERLTIPAPPRPPITRTPRGWRYRCAICPDARAGGLPRYYEAQQAYDVHTRKPGHRKHLAAWRKAQIDG